METKELKSWDDFEKKLEELNQFRESGKVAYGSPANLVFRGQSDAKWPLETTLERSGLIDYSMIKYYQLITEIKSRIEIETKNTWDILELPDYLNWLKGHDFLWTNGLPGLEYMVYLRHHGFPSPLLDWTKDPNIAAYFAFRNIYSDTVSVAIFVYLEHFGIKGFRGEEPNIALVDRNISSEERHKSQHSIYTICSAKEGKESYYSSHEKVFIGNRSHAHPQDRLWKFILPASERMNVIKNLKIKNINAYSLFKSDDSLMESLFLGSLFK